MDYQDQSQRVVIERVLNAGSPDIKASALTTGPHCLRVNTVTRIPRSVCAGGTVGGRK